MTLPIAVCELRGASGLSQQAFAQHVGLSLRAIANYEKGRTPSARSLVRFAKLASHLNRADLASVFSTAFQAEVGDAVIDITEELNRAATLAIRENNGSEWIESQLAGLIRGARKGKPLAYPPILHLDHTPAQESRIAYLETLLVQLRMRHASSAETLLDEMAEIGRAH